MIHIADLAFEVHTAEVAGSLSADGDLFWALYVFGQPQTPPGFELEWEPAFSIEGLPAPMSVYSWRDLMPCRMAWERSAPFADAAFSLGSSWPIHESECLIEREGEGLRVHWRGTTEACEGPRYQDDIPFHIDAWGEHRRIESRVQNEVKARTLLRAHVTDDSPYIFRSKLARRWFELPGVDRTPT